MRDARREDQRQLEVEGSARIVEREGSRRADETRAKRGITGLILANTCVGDRTAGSDSNVDHDVTTARAGSCVRTHADFSGGAERRERLDDPIRGEIAERRVRREIGETGAEGLRIGGREHHRVRKPRVVGEEHGESDVAFETRRQEREQVTQLDQGNGSFTRDEDGRRAHQ